MAERDAATLDKATARDVVETARRHRGLTLAESATALGITKGALSRKLGVRYPDRLTPAEIERLAGYLDLNKQQRDLLLHCYGHRAAPTNLPHALTSFVGRATELAAVRHELDNTRLLTLTGAGGCGKSRLALVVAAAVLPEYPGGVWLVDLAPLADPDRIPQAVAAVLGVREQPGRPLPETLADALGAWPVLLLLDNCEHLVAACAGLAATLLRRCPRLRILATSRQTLAMEGETVVPVPPLSLPEAHESPAPADLARSDAVRLFVERARAARPGFALTAQNAPAVARICRDLDGLPLAIELVAARAGTLGVEELATRLGGRAALRIQGNRTALPHHRSLHATLEWSYGLLTTPEHRLLGRLAVFAGGWDLPAAEVVGADDSPAAAEVIDHLASLVGKSLVQVEERRGVARYRLLETVRAYALEKLEVAGDEVRARQAHLGWSLVLAEEAEAKLSGPEQPAWLARLDQEHDNLRAALGWSIASGHAEAALRLAGALYGFWYIRGYLSEGRRWLDQALAAGDHTPSHLRAKALNVAGALAHSQGDYVTARALYEASLAVARERHDRRGSAISLFNLGGTAYMQGDYTRARLLYDESMDLIQALDDRPNLAKALNQVALVAARQDDYSAARAFEERALALWREEGNQWGIAIGLTNLGLFAARHGDYAIARPLHEESLAIRRSLEDRQGIAGSLGNLGIVAARQGDYETARGLHREAMALWRELDDRRGRADSLYEFGYIAQREGDIDEATARYRESLALRQQLGYRQGIVECIEALAGVAASLARWERAARLLGAASALRHTLGAPPTPPEQAALDRLAAALREAAGLEQPARWRAQGASLTQDQAVSEALAPPRPDPASPYAPCQASPSATEHPHPRTTPPTRSRHPAAPRHPRFLVPPRPAGYNRGHSLERQEGASLHEGVRYCRHPQRRAGLPRRHGQDLARRGDAV